MPMSAISILGRASLDLPAPGVYKVTFSHAGPLRAHNKRTPAGW